MREQTSILHLRPDGSTCVHLLCKESWGQFEDGSQRWSLTCHCGFHQEIDDDTLRRWWQVGSVS